MLKNDEIINTNKRYWNTYADLWFEATALPKYGVHFVTEDDLHLFDDVSGKKYWKYAVEADILLNISPTEMQVSCGA